MADTTVFSRPKRSRFGYATAAVGVILGLTWCAMRLAVEVFPDAFARQDWVMIMPHLIVVPLGLIVLGLRAAIQHRTA